VHSYLACYIIVSLRDNHILYNIFG